MAEAKSVADDTFRELDALRKQQKKLDAQQMNAQRAEIMHNIKQARDAAGVRDESAEPIPKPSRPIEVGDLVEIPGTRRQAEVTAVKDGTLTLKAGVLQMKVKADEVRLIEAAERAGFAKIKLNCVLPKSSRSLPPRSAFCARRPLRASSTSAAWRRWRPKACSITTLTPLSWRISRP